MEQAIPDLHELHYSLSSMGMEIYATLIAVLYRVNGAQAGWCLVGSHDPVLAGHWLLRGVRLLVRIHVCITLRRGGDVVCVRKLCVVCSVTRTGER